MRCLVASKFFNTEDTEDAETTEGTSIRIARVEMATKSVWPVYSVL